MNLADFVPPIVTRAAKRLIIGIGAGPKSARFRGRNFTHRGTSADRGVCTQMFRDRDYDLGRLRRNQEILHFYSCCDDPIIIDAGANIGASAVWFGTEFPKAKIIALEPEADNYSFLQKNAAGLNIQPVFGALASKPGQVNLVDPGEGEWSYRTTESSPSNPNNIRAYSVEELLKTAGTPFILKIDIEGAEEGVFRENTTAIDQFPVVIVELHDWMLPRSKSSLSFLKWHVSQDRDFVHIGENVFSICNRLLSRL